MGGNTPPTGKPVDPTISKSNKPEGITIEIRDQGKRINQLEFNHQEFKIAIEKQLKELENKLISQIDSTNNG